MKAATPNASTTSTRSAMKSLSCFWIALVIASSLVSGTSLGSGGRRPVLKNNVAARKDDLREAAAGEVGLLVEPDRLGHDLREALRRGLEIAEQSPELGLRHQRDELVEKWSCRPDRCRRLAHARDERVHKCARRRQRACEVTEVVVRPLDGRPQQADCLTQISLLRGQRDHRPVEVREEV